MQEYLSEDEFNHLGLTKGYNYVFKIQDGTMIRTFRATYNKVLYEGSDNRITAIYLEDCTGCSALRHLGVQQQRDNTYKIPIRILKTSPEDIAYPIKKYDIDTDLDKNHILKGGKRRKSIRRRSIRRKSIRRKSVRRRRKSIRRKN